MNDKPTAVADRIDTIESAYEFMLAYAAQGRRGTEGGPSEEIRGYLERLRDALDGLAAACASAMGEGSEGAKAFERFRPTLERDAEETAAAVGMILAQPAISSQMIDNLNASVHVRTLLTDLFLIDGVLPKPGTL
jgi:hypothetical protein